MPFKDALLEGIRRAQDAALIKQKIDSFFVEMNDSLQETLPDSGITISKTDEKHFVRNLREFSGNSDNKTQYYNITLSKEDRSIDIANFTESEVGFPCSITYGGKTTVCFDMKDLTESFNELLSSYEVGKILFQFFSE